MSVSIKIQPLAADNFAPFGDVIAPKAKADKIINEGMCARHHDLARLNFGGDGQAGISLFDATPRTLPYRFTMMERHPLGSQAFLPLHEHSFLVIVAEDNNGKPAPPQAFRTARYSGINFHRNIWHGVLTPLAHPGIFAVIDRIGAGANLEEHWFDEEYIVVE